MKKTLLAGLIAGSVCVSAALAVDYKYEISPMVGVNFTEGNMNFDNDYYYEGGLEFQFNYDSFFVPELSVFASQQPEYVNGANTNVIRGVFNAVHTFQTEGDFVPFAKAGMGYETYTNEYAGNQDGFLLDAGVGVKYKLTKAWALKAEAIYTAKHNTNHAGDFDSNLATLVGVTYAFGAVPAVAPKAAPAPAPAPAPKVVEEPTPAPTPAPKIVEEPTPAPAPVVIGDDDQDGVPNNIDKCPNTPTIVKLVDENGCIQDRDLRIHFEFDSYKVDAESRKHVKEFAEFLKKVPVYRVTIIGHTDNVGTHAYNMKLSAKRAEAVKKLLIENGIDPKIIDTKAMGETQPIASNATAEGRAKNRRIEAHLERIK
jgi:OOP family OmpA-OmpF porin